MTQTAVNNAKVLYQLSIRRTSIEEAEKIYNGNRILRTVLESPIIPLEKKNKIIDRIFTPEEYSKELNHFLKLMSKLRQMDEVSEIFQSYYQYHDEQNDIVRASVQYASMPEPDELEQTKAFLEEKYPGKQIIIEEELNKELLGGMRIQVGNEEYDNSYEGRLKQLERTLTGR